MGDDFASKQKSIKAEKDIMRKRSDVFDGVSKGGTGDYLHAKGVATKAVGPLMMLGGALMALYGAGVLGLEGDKTGQCLDEISNDLGKWKELSTQKSSIRKRILENFE